MASWFRRAASAVTRTARSGASRLSNSARVAQREARGAAKSAQSATSTATRKITAATSAAATSASRVVAKTKSSVRKATGKADDNLKSITSKAAGAVEEGIGSVGGLARLGSTQVKAGLATAGAALVATGGAVIAGTDNFLDKARNASIDGFVRGVDALQGEDHWAERAVGNLLQVPTSFLGLDSGYYSKVAASEAAAQTKAIEDDIAFYQGLALDETVADSSSPESSDGGGATGETPSDSGSSGGSSDPTGGSEAPPEVGGGAEDDPSWSWTAPFSEEREVLAGFNPDGSEADVGDKALASFRIVGKTAVAGGVVAVTWYGGKRVFGAASKTAKRKVASRGLRRP